MWCLLHFTVFEVNEVSEENGDNILFKRNEIQLGATMIRLLDINKIKMELNDYLGKVEFRNPRDFTPFQSQGFGNSIQIVTKKGKTHHCMFQIKNKENKLDIEPFIFSLIEFDIISSESGLNILGIKKKKDGFEKRLSEFIKSKK